MLSGANNFWNSESNTVSRSGNASSREHRSLHRGANSMRNFCRVITIGLLVSGVLMIAPNSWAQNRAPVLEKIAKAYGIDSFGQIEAVRYTWSGEIPGLFKVSHVWEWEPKSNKVTFETKDKDGKPVKVAYVRTDMS